MKDEVLNIFVTLFFTSAFLVPGFIIHRTISLFITPTRRGHSVICFAFPHVYAINIFTLLSVDLSSNHNKILFTPSGLYQLLYLLHFLCIANPDRSFGRSLLTKITP